MKNVEIDIAERAERGRNNFLTGLNCAQSVLAAFSDVFDDIDMDTAMRMAASFGCGMGRLRLTCGAVSALAMLSGMIACACRIYASHLAAMAMTYKVIKT